MELFELLRLLSEVSTAVLIAGIMLTVWRSRDQVDKRGDEITLKLIALLGDLSINIKASTDTLTNMYKEVGSTHTTQLDALSAIQTALAALPDATAGAVKTSLTPDFDEIRVKLQSAVLSISSVCIKLDEIRDSALSDCNETTEIKPNDSAPMGQESKGTSNE